MSFKFAMPGKRRNPYAGIPRDYKKAPRTKRSKRTTHVVPGKTRTGGFYGKYNRPDDGETKFFDTTVNFSIDTTGEVPATGLWNLIPQGVTESQRIGRKCVVKSIQYRGIMVYSPGAAANAADVSHMYLVMDTQANGAAATVTDVLTSNNMGVALRNMDNAQRFKVLKHWKHTWNPGAGVTGAYAQQIKHMEYFKKCEIPLVFDSTTGAITEIRSNNIFILAGTAGQSDDLIAVQGRARVRFVG